LVHGWLLLRGRWYFGQWAADDACVLTACSKRQHQINRIYKQKVKSFLKCLLWIGCNDRLLWTFMFHTGRALLDQQNQEFPKKAPVPYRSLVS
jgi:hypothetical protein